MAPRRRHSFGSHSHGHGHRQRTGHSLLLRALLENSQLARGHFRTLPPRPPRMGAVTLPPYSRPTSPSEWTLASSVSSWAPSISSLASTEVWNSGFYWSPTGSVWSGTSPFPSGSLISNMTPPPMSIRSGGSSPATFQVFHQLGLRPSIRDHIRWYLLTTPRRYLAGGGIAILILILLVILGGVYLR